MSEQIDREERGLAAWAGDLSFRQPAPSAREAAAGVGRQAPLPRPSAPPPPSPERTTLRAQYMASLRLLDPRGIGGPGQRLPLVVLCLLSTLGSFDNAAFAILFVLIKADLGFDLQYLFTMTSALGIVVTLTSPVGGYLADRISRVWMLRVGSLIDNASSIFSGLAGSPGALATSRFVGGLGPAVYVPALFPLLTDYFPIEKRARTFGFLTMVGTVWGLVSSLFLALGVLAWGWFTWRQVLVGTGVLATAVSIATFLMKEPIRGEVDRLSMGADADTAAVEEKPASWAEAWRAASGIGTLRKLWYATPFISVASAGTGTLLFFAMEERLATSEPTGITGILLNNPKFALALPALYLLVPQIAGLLVTPVAVGLADKMMVRRPGRILYYAGVLQALQAVSLVLILVIPDFVLGFLISSVFGLAVALINPARGVLLSAVVPARIRGLGFQTLAPWQLLGLLMLPVLGGVADTYGPIAGVIGLVPVTIIGCLILISSGANVEDDIRRALASSLADEASRSARAQGTNKMIVCRDIDVTYDGARVLSGVDFDVEEGELIAVMGTNGAGKSTLLRAICGIHHVSNGAIFLDGEDITYKPPHLNARDGVVFLPGGRATFPLLTVEENLKAAAWLYRDDEDYVTHRTEEVLGFFPVLRDRFHVQAGNLSGGEQQMVALAQSFLMRPRLLMIDELSLGLAPAVVEQLLEIVRAISAQGTTVILVEQSVNVALTLADRAVFMEKGQIRFDGPTEDLLSRGDLMRAVFLGATTGAFVGVGGERSAPSDTNDAPVLEMRGIHVSYGGAKALSGVSLEVGPHEIVGIVGPNGAGKTTLFDVISGFLEPNEGTVWIAGVDATVLPTDGRARLGLARSFQDTRLFASLTVRESIAVALHLRAESHSALLSAAWAPALRRSEQRVYRRVDYLVDLLGLGDMAEKFINELSTGSRRIVDLACMMATEPKILLLDEPSSGMAQAEIEVLAPVVQRLAREAGCGILVIEHDMPLITAMSNLLIAMELGSVIAEGRPEAVMADQRVLGAYLNASDSVINRSGSLFNRAAASIGLTVKPREGR